jgi:hypothetical protein
MNQSWKHLDLAGGGVQALNLLLARQLKKRRTAYCLLALLPLGLHRFYLASPVMGTLYILASLAAARLRRALRRGRSGRGRADTGRLRRWAVPLLRRAGTPAQGTRPAPEAALKRAAFA